MASGRVSAEKSWRSSQLIIGELPNHRYFHIAFFELDLQNLRIGTVVYPRRMSTNGRPRYSRPTQSTVCLSSTVASRLRKPPVASRIAPYANYCT